MRLPLRDEPNIGTKCLGCYEAELHGPIEKEIARLNGLKSPLIVNLGCSLGYYTVGLAMRLPGATVIGVDNRPDRFAFVHEAAERNGVAVTTVAASEFQMQPSDLVVSDCEGAEADYLDPEKFPFLLQTTMLVETHDETAGILSARFKASHHIFSTPSERSRDPSQYPCLRGLHSHAKWIAVSENRPKTAPYFYMVPKTRFQG